MAYLFEFAAGAVAGALGMVPFLHTNLLLEFTKNAFAALGLAVFAAALAFSHSVFEIIPAVFLFVPSGGQALSMLPAHSLALKGRALFAARTVLHSMFYSFLAALAILPLAIVFLPPLFEAVRPYSAFLLAAIVAGAFAMERGKKLAAGVFIFLLSGFFGFLLFSFPLQREPLFPLLSGLFGIPAVMLSMNGKSVEPGKDEAAAVDAKMVVVGAVLGMLSPLLPALNPALLSGLALIFLESTPVAFLQVNSAVASSKMLYDFTSVFIAGKARSGAAVAVKEAVFRLEWSQFVSVLAAGAAAFFAALAVVLFASKKLSTTITALGNRLNLVVLGLIVAGVFAYSGPAGLFTAAVASCIGLVPALVGTRRSHAMGALILPSMIYSLGLAGEITRFIKS
ncbi:MAG: tripartite tricarboxylate transporter permease [Candidatus Micrarchaeota archaeon]|nr:tripartite tricarboxylate transporter permease [Candidatus Micrarchaeota archaeon]